MRKHWKLIAFAAFVLGFLTWAVVYAEDIRRLFPMPKDVLNNPTPKSALARTTQDLTEHSAALLVQEFAVARGEPITPERVRLAEEGGPGVFVFTFEAPRPMGFCLTRVRSGWVVWPRPGACEAHTAQMYRIVDAQ